MENLHWTEVDGITTIWTEAPEPLRAGLMFRTGKVDETLITAGCTHLIEHMALAELGDFTHTPGGFVSDAFTGFITVGRPEDVSIFFRNVCNSLASLPADRLEAEKKILLAEAARQPYNVYGNLLIWRYGAAGYGLVGEPELGIRGATIEQLQTWRNQHFTRGNAILWLSGPVPSDLRLELPEGEKWAVPQLVPIQRTFPSWHVDDQCGGIAASSIVPRLSEGPIFNMITAKRLHEELRNKQAVSYSPAMIYNPFNADTAHLVFFADSELSRRSELSNSFGKIFEQLSEIDESEVEATRTLYLDHTTGPLAPPLADRLVIEAQRAAMDWLFGMPHKTLDQLAEDACSVNADMVRAFAQVAQKNMMFAVPGKAIIQPWMGELSPISPGEAVKGQKILPVDAPIQTGWLIVGPTGVSIKFSIDSHLTVRYTDLVVALHFDDGGLKLVNSDSLWLVIEPTLWRNGAKICDEILKRIPAHLILEQGPRDQNAIPKPKTTAWQRLRASLK